MLLDAYGIEYDERYVFSIKCCARFLGGIVMPRGNAPSTAPRAETLRPFMALVEILNKL